MYTYIHIYTIQYSDITLSAASNERKFLSSNTMSRTPITSYIHRLKAFTNLNTYTVCMYARTQFYH